MSRLTRLEITTSCWTPARRTYTMLLKPAGKEVTRNFTMHLLLFRGKFSTCTRHRPRSPLRGDIGENSPVLTTEMLDKDNWWKCLDLQQQPWTINCNFAMWKFTTIPKSSSTYCEEKRRLRKWTKLGMREPALFVLFKVLLLPRAKRSLGGLCVCSRSRL